ncbi:MAG: hypothetical protein JST55_07010 [Bacteroidetes bacterium]|nr:hypothetical protein [Bacteroidota bacterium]
MDSIKIILISIFFLAGINALNAQEIKIKSFKELDLLNESNSLQKETLKDTIKKKSGPKPFVMKKSPLKAVLLSAVLPGLGQYYNESYWKIPLVALVGGYFGYTIIDQNNKFLDYRDRYIASQTPGNPAGDQQILTTRNFYKDQRDKFIFYFGIFYVVNLVDAYVDAHLYDFDVSDKIRVGFDPSKINLKINF